jgi:predicted nucleic acid-binding protein
LRPVRRRTGADLRAALAEIPPPDEQFEAGIAGRPRSAHDLVIAAHALQTDRTVLTFDAKARFGDLPGLRVAEVASS